MNDPSVTAGAEGSASEQPAVIDRAAQVDDVEAVGGDVAEQIRADREQLNRPTDVKAEAGTRAAGEVEHAHVAANVPRALIDAADDARRGKRFARWRTRAQQP